MMQSDPLIGRKLGAYHILAPLGEGGMARVYRGYDEFLRREVAIKVIRPQNGASMAEFQARFIQEAQLIANLQHRNIVVVYGFGEEPDMVYLAMQYVAGGTLRDQLKSGPLEPRRAALYALQIARALHHAHLHGIVHRDVKPPNMLVSAINRNELLLSDFGIARLLSNRAALPLPASEGGSESTRSLPGDVAGTPLYMAPEQCSSAPVDARTDIYALGVVLFEMLAGQPPFQGNFYALSYQHVHVPAPSVLTINPAVPTELAQITARALEKDPAYRYQTAKEMGQALETFLRQTSSTRLSVPLPVPASRRRKKNVLARQLFAGLFTLLALALILVGTGVLRLPFVVSPLASPTSAGLANTSSCTSSATAGIAQPFSETFQDNQRGWQHDPSGAITPRIAGNAYLLSVANSDNAYFVCPDGSHVGTLPNNFTLTTRMEQRQGGSGAFYGLAFHLTSPQNSNTVSAYAFVIDGDGACALLKYDAQKPGRYTILQSLTHFSPIHKNAANTLQVLARGNQFSFSINGSAVPFSNASDQGDAPYTGGQLGLLVSGPNTAFTATSVQLNIP